MNGYVVNGYVVTFGLGLMALVAAARVPEAVAAPIPPPGSVAPDAAAQATPAEREARRGFTALAKGDLAVAEAAFRASMLADPHFPPAYLGLADVALRRGQAAEARRQIEAGLKAAPANSGLLAAMGRLQASQGETREALKWLDQAIAADPRNAAAYADIGDVQLNGLRSPDAAAAAYRSAIKVDPLFARPRVGLGLALAAQGRYDDAVAELEQAAKLETADPGIPHLIGRVYGQQKDLEKALAAFSEALTRRANFEPALRDRADVAAELKRNAIAVADYRAILVMAPTDAQTMVKLGMVYDRMGRSREAEGMYRDALRISPNFAVAFNNLAWNAAMRRTDLDQALFWAKRAVELAPKVPQFRDTLGWVHRTRGESAAALAAFEQATKLEPPLAEAYYHLGLVYRDMDRPKESDAAFRRALEISRDFAGAEDARRALARNPN